MNKKYYLAALHKIWFTHKNLFDIFSDNYDYDKVYNNLDYNLLSKFNLTDTKISKILKNKQELDFSGLIEKIDNLWVELIVFGDNKYPDELKNIFNSPYVLYIRWNIKLPWISFIGSRMMTFYWKKIIEKFIPEIWNYFTIISWWAIWCDTYSHKIALNNNIPTISVLWTWIDMSYPSSNKKMYEDIIIKWWALISIFPLWEKGFSYNFPIRNEIVAWLSKWVFIVEAKEKSWTMITAKLALDLWKDLFCVAWDIFKTTSWGCNKLISSWEAKFVFKVDDILNEYNIYLQTKVSKVINITDKDELKIYNCLVNENMTIDDLMNELSFDIATLSFKLSMLEISWYVKITPDWKYEIN